MRRFWNRFWFAWAYAYDSEKWQAFKAARRLIDVSKLLDEMPIMVYLHKNESQMYTATHSRVESEGGWFYAEAKTAEEALVKLREQLIERGVIKR